uniref:Uncharacterized protein n=1 Tax=Amphimedon queenslandica TaxID=400682 RepID=A0A1X7UXQ8_AMPQE
TTQSYYNSVTDLLEYIYRMLWYIEKLMLYYNMIKSLTLCGLK